MAAIARSVGPALRFLTRKQVSTHARGYAEMSFTFASGNQVCNVGNLSALEI